MQVIFYDFVKPLNSSAIPADPYSGFSDELDCNLKAGCSVTSPIMEVVTNYIQYPWFRYGYAYIPDFHRYYFVTDWTWENGVWIAAMSCDVLGSFRDAINDRVEYIARSESAYNANLIDNTYPTETNPTIDISEWLLYSGYLEGAAHFVNSPTYGWYIVGILNSSENALGSVTYYAMTYGEYADFRAAMLDSIDWATFQDMEISQPLFKALFNPFQYIVSCRWIPIEGIDVSGWQQINNVKLGWWNVPNVTAYEITRGAMSGKVVVDLPDFTNHPQATTVKYQYLNSSPYSMYSIHHPLIGDVPIEISVTIDRPLHVRLECVIDYSSGESTTTGWLMDSTQRVQFAFQRPITIAVDLLTAQIANNPVQTMFDYIAGTVTSLATLNLEGATSTVMSAINSLLPVATSSGANGAIGYYTAPVIVESKHFNIVETDESSIGSPLYERRRLGDLTGFVQCLDSHPAIRLGDDDPYCATMSELEQVKQHLDAGFFRY